MALRLRRPIELAGGPIKIIEATDECGDAAVDGRERDQRGSGLWHLHEFGLAVRREYVNDVTSRHDFGSTFRIRPHAFAVLASCPRERRPVERDATATAHVNVGAAFGDARDDRRHEYARRRKIVGERLELLIAFAAFEGDSRFRAAPAVTAIVGEQSEAHGAIGCGL